MPNLKEKQKWSHQKLYENCEGSISLTQGEDKEFTESIKNTRRKLDTSMAPGLPCKIMKKNCSDACNKISTRLACILESDESTRMRMGESLPNHHEDHTALQEKETIHYTTTIWFANLFLCLKP